MPLEKKPVIGFQCPKCGSFSVVTKEEKGLKSLFDWEDIVWSEGT